MDRTKISLPVEPARDQEVRVRPLVVLLFGALSALSLLVLSPATLGSAEETRVQDVDQLVEKFEKAHRGKKGAQSLEQILEDLGTELPSFAAGDTEDPSWRRIRQAAARLAVPPEKTTKSKAKSARPTAKKSAEKDRSPSTPHRHPLPEELTYRFGTRDLADVEGAPRDLATRLHKGQLPRVEDLSVTTRLRKLLCGCLPESELALATYQRELDVWSQGDPFECFLESWRNPGPQGDESFYEALDRSADTQEEVFFYDAMLDEFVRTFAPKEGRDWSLQERHDKLHLGFLAYRQYRGFVEAIAYAAVYPSTVRFPAQLSRYDSSKLPNLYHLRDNLDVLAAAAGGDYDVVLAECKAFLLEHPFPEQPWQGYTIASDFAAYFTQRVPEITKTAARGTDDLLREQRARTAKLAQALSESTSRAISGEK